MNNDIQQKQKPQPLRVVHIETLNRKGQGVGKTDAGGKLTAPYTIPGEIVEVRKIRRREGVLQQILAPSPHRVQPACRHFGVCGGCSWQHIDYARQLQYKCDRVFQRFLDCAVPLDRVSLEIESADPFEYRNRMDFLWWHNGRFGLRERGKWYSAVNLEECRLLPEAVMQTALEVNRRVKELGLPYRDGKHKIPGLRYLIIRRGVFTGDIQLSFVTDSLRLPPVLWDGLEHVNSVYQLVNDNLENDNSDGEPIHLWGEPFYRERIGEREFCVGPRSFFQPNPVMANRMVDFARQTAAAFKTKQGLIDLYCGIGLFALSLSDCFEKVIGVENNAEAVALAKRNAGGSPVRFACLEAEKWDWPDSQDYDALLVDPPRTGLHPKIIETLKTKPFQNILYVSCNPSRGVEDIAALFDVYELSAVKLFDQFPQTVHVEMIAHLLRKS
ncbi:MAG: 23S rRNA (uracil(1939)-C(5))-methyltransferase RlmD [Candidatus Omnitrophica bacterium]|nr:23S rRNA (uracil(1939)-C(5))-methyltransferase RlmD [Candidatus Omnitrophota bacterium]